MYADNTQYYDSCRFKDTAQLQSRLAQCASDIDLWCRSRHVQLNADKTEAIWFGSVANLASSARSTVLPEWVLRQSVVRNLGLHLDNRLCICIIIIIIQCNCSEPITC